MLELELTKVLNATDEQIILIERCSEYVAKLKKIPYGDAKKIICDTITEVMQKSKYPHLIDLVRVKPKEKKLIFDEIVLSVIEKTQLHPKIDFFSAQKLYSDWRREFNI
ncbi:MAG: hypothetical protein JXR63_10030 [Spirochaetales bacterium]|nr:hypothetical protein [Spirochaetales bacterium]